MNIYLEKLAGLSLIIIGIIYFRWVSMTKAKSTSRGTGHGYIAGVAIIVFGIILLLGLRKH